MEDALPQHRHDLEASRDEGRRRFLGAPDGVADSDLTIGIRLGPSAGLRREEICGLR